MTAVKSTVLMSLSRVTPAIAQVHYSIWGYGRVADFVLGVHSEVVLASLSLRYHSYPVGQVFPGLRMLC
jgi:hypothetical protein